ncbi:uncharacterized protein TNCV_4869511 [Trichonephila clavipes]|nr:uncharacterized protein TNCV_4869511 [Trichonephila clavipes]
MSKEALVDHIFVRLEPQDQDFVEVRNPQNTVQLLEVLSKFEERYSCKAMRGSRDSNNVERRGWNRVGCLILMIIEEIGDIRKLCAGRVMAEMIIGGVRKTLVVSCVGRFGIPMYSHVVGFIRGSKNILDFDRKSLVIPDSQIDKVVKTIEGGKVEIDLSKTRLEEKQKQKLRDLFNSFQGLFSDKPGLTHVLHHEIDTGDKPLVVSRP